MHARGQPVSPEKLAAIIDAHRGQRWSLIPLLQAIQDEFGYVPRQAVGPVARALRLFESEVQGVISFYAQFYTEPRGRHIVRVCRGTACHVRGGKSILKVVREKLGIDDGETTVDLQFSLETVACLGACFAAPSMLIDGSYFGRLAPPRVASILEMYEKKQGR
ncbi:MAG: NADH-quinone oxidoreductase subunit NuoE [Deltaproteobacteria bacterium]|nr:NADH-quinone oxidoreductase subunit NuoE [Deltaproteobacteria bacterium]